MRTNLWTFFLAAITLGCYTQNIGIGRVKPGQQLDGYRGYELHED